jgi:hypothetical protein
MHDVINLRQLYCHSAKETVTDHHDHDALSALYFHISLCSQWLQRLQCAATQPSKLGPTLPKSTCQWHLQPEADAMQSCTHTTKFNSNTSSWCGSSNQYVRLTVVVHLLHPTLPAADVAGNSKTHTHRRMHAVPNAARHMHSAAQHSCCALNAVHMHAVTACQLPMRRHNTQVRLCMLCMLKLTPHPPLLLLLLHQMR